MRAQGHNEYSTWSHKCLMLWHSSCILTPEILRILGVQGRFLAEGIMGTVRRMARAHCSMIDWTGVLSDAVC
jgi:hypothetical protein